ncbi:hypothetical protein L544_0876 [Bordetella hinzii OH87 BAL007II]|uniref:Uncharacterized protein n=1 Tax=Bordetella hinzii OH87 BAL007II TaxID=1331262 RepID=A0ABR4R3M2_9BORD|nr:hypothetical protein L544_0876 [Bordetella hinzii OH87 BAL007II]
MIHTAWYLFNAERIQNKIPREIANTEYSSLSLTIKNTEWYVCSGSPCVRRHTGLAPLSSARAALAQSP